MGSIEFNEIDMCVSKRTYVLKEKRIYKDLVVEALFSDSNVLVNAECIVNIDINPQQSYLNQVIKETVLACKEQESEVDDVSEISEQNNEQLDLELGKWYIQRINRRFFRHTNYMAHLKIDETITSESMVKLYLELFFMLAQKNIQMIVVPAMWLDQYKYQVSQKQNADAFFEQLFNWRNQDQKYRVSVTIYHTDEAKTYPIIDSFLAQYNIFNPILGELHNEVSLNQEDNDDDVDEDQKMLK